MNKFRLVLADQDDGFRALLADVLAEAGYEVLKASECTQILQYCERHRVAVAIVDLTVPEKEGFETIFELRRRFPDVRTMATCGGASGPIDRCLHMARLIGAEEILVKPFGTAEVISAVRRVLGQDSFAIAAEPRG